MELIAAVLLAGPAGFYARTRRQGLVFYLLAWAIIFPVQTVAVLTDTEPSGDDWTYWPINALILAGGLALNRLGATIADRRAAGREGAAAMS